MVNRIRNIVSKAWFHATVAVSFVGVMAVGYQYDGLNFVQGWGGGIAAVIATFFLVFKSQGYWAWMMINAGLWTALFFNMGLPMLAYLQISILLFSVYGMTQWALVKYDIGFRLNRRSDVVGAILATLLFGYSFFAYIRMDGYAWTTWWYVELASVVFAILAMWMDAYRYKANWFMWTASNCFSAPLFYSLASWGPFYTIFAYQTLNVIGYIIWRNEEKEMKREKRAELVKHGDKFEHGALVTSNV
jgi:nicotinamide mononucleotide transporter